MNPSEIVAELRALIARIEAVPEVPVPPPPVLKPVLSGLVDRQSDVARAVKHGIPNVVVTETWEGLQPLGIGEFDDRALQEELGLARSAGLRVRLRVLGGIYAPDWAKQIGGAPFQVTVDDKTGTCGRWWHPDYIAAWRELHRQLAGVFDGDPVIADVDWGGGCGIVAAEPFLRGGKKGPTTLAMVAAGFDVEADWTAIDLSVACVEEWATTRGYLALNPYQSVDPKGVVTIESTATVGTITEYRHDYRARLVLGNDSIRWAIQPGYPEMYDAIRDAGPPISFQTATPEKLLRTKAEIDAKRVLDPELEAGRLAVLFAWVLEQGASSVELPRSYPTWDAQKLAEFNAQLIANAGVA